MTHNDQLRLRNRLRLILGSASAIHAATCAAPSFAADTGNDSLEEIVITGSLIPRARAETSAPALVITAEDLQSKGFASVADALQHSVPATGAVQGPQNTGGFTPGASTLSLFGLSPSYTKFLIDGRPIADYPALYNGTDIIASIDGIPALLVDHIDILPGGQSSIYGSDAIAGVVNIVMKRSLDGAVADVRYGWTKDGGGTDRRIGLADGIERGPFRLVVGGQYEKKDPVWGYQRRLTDQFYAAGSTPQTAARDWVVIGLNGQANGDLYYQADPASCANVADQINGSVGLRYRKARGQYCGSFRSGFYTIDNGTEAEQAYLHAAYDASDNLHLFSDLLLDRDVAIYNPGTASLQTASDSAGPYNYFSDPFVSTSDLLNVQRIFTPEEAGNLREQNNRNTKNSIRATFGADGRMGATPWNYSLDVTFSRNKLTETTYLAFENAINSFFSGIFGPNLGPDPNFGQPTYNVNWAQFYKPLTPAQYASFTGYAVSYSQTEETLARGQLTNSALFHLPGGDAGLALVVEGGPQGWDYRPDPRFLNGGTYLYTATAGSGHRSHYAGTAELRLPVLSTVVVDLSNRYDAYKVDGSSVTRDTYNFGVEYRPLKAVLLRGRYGTSFKSPTLSDQFQGQSGFFQTINDYYTCAKKGFTGTNIGNCPQANISVFGTTSGNPKLQPITAKNWSVGTVWTPLERLAVKLDYLSWTISNEVAQQDSDKLLQTNSACLLGQLSASSPTCVAAIGQVERDATGNITQISTPKQNVASERLSVFVLSLAYGISIGQAGDLVIDGAYSDLTKHDQQRFAGDPVIDLINNPFYSTDFKTKANLSVAWDLNRVGATLYAERYGRTPNYAAQQTVAGYAAPGAGNVGTWTIANLSARYQATKDLDLSVNVNNLFNTLPPDDHSWPGIYDGPFSNSNYNNYGRSYFVNVGYRFGR